MTAISAVPTAVVKQGPVERGKKQGKQVKTYNGPGDMYAYDGPGGHHGWALKSVSKHYGVLCGQVSEKKWQELETTCYSDLPLPDSFPILLACGKITNGGHIAPGYQTRIAREASRDVSCLFPHSLNCGRGQSNTSEARV